MRRLFTALAITVALIAIVAADVSLACYQCVPDFNTGGAYCESSVSGGKTCYTSGVHCILHEPCVGGYCFLQGTLIDTPDGPVPIEDIQVGDLVSSYDESSGEVVSAPVSNVLRSVEVGYVVINGSLSVTETHPFWIDGGWVEINEIQLGDELQGENGETVVVNSLERVDRGVRVYNITVDDTHTFFADGVLVHNKGPDPQG